MQRSCSVSYTHLVSDKGTLCYTYDGELYTQKSGARPEKVKVELVRDDEQQLATLKFSQGATSASVSPDGKQIAFIVITNNYPRRMEVGLIGSCANSSYQDLSRAASLRCV